MSDSDTLPQPSAEVRTWLENRARFHRAWASLMVNEGACIMPTRKTVDPRYLDEPLRSDVIAYLRSIGEWAS